MSYFLLLMPVNGILIACFLGFVVGIHFFGKQLEKSGYATLSTYRWFFIFVLTFIVSIPSEYFISASDGSIKKAIDCINQTKNLSLREYMKSELDRNNVRAYKVDRVYRQCISDKIEAEHIQKRKAQSQTLF